MSFSRSRIGRPVRPVTPRPLTRLPVTGISFLSREASAPPIRRESSSAPGEDLASAPRQFRVALARFLLCFRRSVTGDLGNSSDEAPPFLSRESSLCFFGSVSDSPRSAFIEGSGLDTGEDRPPSGDESVAHADFSSDLSDLRGLGKNLKTLDFHASESALIFEV